MYRFLRIILIPVLIFLFSCEKTGYIVTCSECTAEEPATGVLEAELDLKNWDTAMIRIWEGNLEDSLLIGSYDAYGATFDHEVTLNLKYTVTATYHLNGRDITAVDAVTPRVRYEKAQCNDPCYFIYDRKLDLKLHYTH